MQANTRKACTASLKGSLRERRIEDRFGFPRPPEIAVERDSRLAFARLVRELDLDTEATPDGKRPPALPSNRRAKHAATFA
jgi:hypothetical protein